MKIERLSVDRARHCGRCGIELAHSVRPGRRTCKDCYEVESIEKILAQDGYTAMDIADEQLEALYSASRDGRRKIMTQVRRGVRRGGVEAA